MSTKLYSFHTTAIDQNEKPHVVTIVGQFKSCKEEVDHITDLNVVWGPNKETSGTMIYKTKRPIRTLTYAYSICHPEDTFDEQTGIAIATRRLKTDPMGELKTKYVTCLCKDQIEHILQGELDYLSRNIDKFIEKK